jgi:hypothetical protein
MKRKLRIEDMGSFGKKGLENNDAIYAGTNYSAVIDGVSHKSQIVSRSKKIEIAELIVEAIRNLDKSNAPAYAKKLSFPEFVRYINGYISSFYNKYNMSQELEATAVIYSRYLNQIWLIGDCRAICDERVIENPLVIDSVYSEMRKLVIEVLLSEGYDASSISDVDISKKIVEDIDKIRQYIKDVEKAARLYGQLKSIMQNALLDAGFTKGQIVQEELFEKYKNPKKLQEYAKNNPNAGILGYAVFNGRYTEVRNCKVVKLPANIKNITLASDGFPTEVLKGRSIAKAVRAERKQSAENMLGLGYTRVAFPYKERQGRIIYNMDDTSALIFSIIR